MVPQAVRATLVLLLVGLKHVAAHRSHFGQRTSKSHVGRKRLRWKALLTTAGFRCPIPSQCHISASLDRGDHRNNHCYLQQYHLHPVTGYSLQHCPSLQYTNRVRPEQRIVQQLHNFFDLHLRPQIQLKGFLPHGPWTKDISKKRR